MSMPARGPGNRGQVLPFVLVCLVVLVLIGVAFFAYNMIMGGGKELHNAVDAGNLNVAVTALDEPKVVLEDLPNREPLNQFRGVAEEEAADKHSISLRNLNRVWGEALIAYLNVKAMTDQGLATPQAYENSNRIYDAALEVSNALTRKIKEDDDSILSSAFSDMASSNTLRMLGVQTTIRPTTNIPGISYVDRGLSSNIKVSSSQGIDWSQFPTAGFFGSQYLKGYVSQDVSNGQSTREFAFLPLEAKRKPHLISASEFKRDADSQFLSDLSNAIPPIAFSYASTNVQERRSGSQLASVAFSVAKENQAGFSSGFPQGFIRIRNIEGLPGSQLAADAGRGNPPGFTAGDNLHVLDYTHRAIGFGYRTAFVPASALGLRGQDRGNLYARTGLNPIAQPWGMYFQGTTINTLKCALCIPAMDICMDHPSPADPLRWACCCLYKFPVIRFAYGPLHRWLFIAGDFEYGFEPCREKGCVQNRTSFGTSAHSPVYPTNIGFWRILYDWEGQWFVPTYLGVLIEFAIESALDPLAGTGDPGMSFWFHLIPIDFELIWQAIMHAVMSQDLDDSKLLLYSRMLPPKRVSEGHTSPDFGSGMRVARPPSQVGSMFWNGTGTPKTYSDDGTIGDFFDRRKSDPNVRNLIAQIKRRIRQISVDIPDGDIDQVLASNKELKMGDEAYVYLGDDNRLKVGVRGVDSLPPWLERSLDVLPDGNADAAADISYPADPSRRSCYKLVRPTQDWSGYSNWPHDAAYPAQVCLHDDYRFVPSSGHDGLLGVVELRSRLDKRCSFGSQWNNPVDCFPNAGITGLGLF